MIWLRKVKAKFNQIFVTLFHLNQSYFLLCPPLSNLFQVYICEGWGSPTFFSWHCFFLSAIALVFHSLMVPTVLLFLPPAVLVCEICKSHSLFGLSICEPCVSIGSLSTAKFCCFSCSPRASISSNIRATECTQIKRNRILHSGSSLTIW